MYMQFPQVMQIIVHVQQLHVIAKETWFIVQFLKNIKTPCDEKALNWKCVKPYNELCFLHNLII